MPSESMKIEKQQPVELTPDFLGESRHEFVARLAYQHWERRGMPHNLRKTGLKVTFPAGFWVVTSEWPTRDLRSCSA